MEETHSGFDGYVRTANGVIGGIRHWTVTYTQETLEVSRFNPTASGVARRFRRYKPGPLGWTAAFDGFVMPGDTGQIEIKDAMDNGNEVDAYFHVNGDKFYAGKGLLTTENPDVAWDAVATQSFAIQGTEPLTKTGWE